MVQQPGHPLKLLTKGLQVMAASVPILPYGISGTPQSCMLTSRMLPASPRQMLPK